MKKGNKFGSGRRPREQEQASLFPTIGQLVGDGSVFCNGWLAVFGGRTNFKKFFFEGFRLLNKYLKEHIISMEKAKYNCLSVVFSYGRNKTNGMKQRFFSKAKNRRAEAYLFTLPGTHCPIVGNRLACSCSRGRRPSKLSSL